MLGRDRTVVVGHRNPDTDSVASAMAYAWLLSHSTDGEAIAARAGALDRRAAWVLDRLKMEPPPLLTDAAPTFGDVAKAWDTLRPDQPLSEAWMLAQKTGSVAPLVDAAGKPYGLVTASSSFGFLMRVLGQEQGRQDPSLSLIAKLPCVEACDTTVPRFAAHSRVKDHMRQVFQEERDDFWVVDDDGNYVGVCRKPDLLNPPRLRVILVDHNEPDQAIGSLEEAILLEVLDHHRLANPPTRLPIRFHVDPVGSTSTLVFERVREAGLQPPPDIAGLLLAGLVSDTLLLRSPTTTDRDREVARQLGVAAFVEGAPLAGESLDSYGQQILAAGTDLAGRRNLADALTGDLKAYEAAGMRFGISQLEVASLTEVTDHVDVLREALGRLRVQQGFDLAVLMVTDVVAGSSWIMTDGASSVLAGLPYPLLQNGCLDATGVVSRKKQLLPAMLAVLEE